MHNYNTLCSHLHRCLLESAEKMSLFWQGWRCLRYKECSLAFLCNYIGYERSLSITSARIVTIPNFSAVFWTGTRLSRLLDI